MRIGLNFLNSGLANNGGTRILLKSAEVLEKLGHEVEVIATVDRFSVSENNLLAGIKQVMASQDSIVVQDYYKENLSLPAAVNNLYRLIADYLSW